MSIRSVSALFRSVVYNRSVHSQANSFVFKERYHDSGVILLVTVGKRRSGELLFCYPASREQVIFIYKTITFYASYKNLEIIYFKEFRNRLARSDLHIDLRLVR